MSLVQSTIKKIKTYQLEGLTTDQIVDRLGNYEAGFLNGVMSCLYGDKGKKLQEYEDKEVDKQLWSILDYFKREVEKTTGASRLKDEVLEFVKNKLTSCREDSILSS